MNIGQIETNLQDLLKSFNKATFIFDLLLAYGQPKASITRLKKGGLNLSKTPGEIAWKKKLFFKEVCNEDIHLAIDNIKVADITDKLNPRFIIVTDYETLLSIDRKTADTLDIPILDLVKHYDFFLPWAGIEKMQHQNENPADVKAAERMAKLFDEIKKDNPTTTDHEIHSLNVFLIRLLFCLFADDTGIFEYNQFTNALSSHTQADGSDAQAFFDKFFRVLNTELNLRGEYLPAYLAAFPYVNGGLYRDQYSSPIISRRSRQTIIESGELDWSAINPDIFGSMMQAVVTPEHRGSMGMHYTSVPNIMKVIRPLFLDELYDEFESSKGNPRKLNLLLNRIHLIKIFDPACGSGNFLVIAYKELRNLEMLIFSEMNSLAFSSIRLSNYHGIELDDFAHEIAILSLWLAEHQMNQLFFSRFGRTKPSLPLIETGNIVRGNACCLDWEKVCNKDEGDEIYIIGNPPYVGFLLQDKQQKEDMLFAFNQHRNISKLDYIACWFYLASKYIRNWNSSFAFVSTNSLCQGEQVDLLWPLILNNGLEIGFAHTSFKWVNNARNNAGVIVVIVGVRNTCIRNKYLYSGKHKYIAENINAYLANGSNIYIRKRNKSISDLPQMTLGSSPYENGLLLLSQQEKDDLIIKYPQATKYIKRFVGSVEYLRSIEKYCLWITSDNLEQAKLIPEICERLLKIKVFREHSNRSKTLETANTPHLFTEDRHQDCPSLIIPIVSSENREYITCGFLDRNNIIPNSARIIYNPEPWIFGLISSRMHIVWVRAVAGRLKTDFRYSASLCYNTFPFPCISKVQIQEIEMNVYRIIDAREIYSEKTLSQLYSTDKMPKDLYDAHHQLDLTIERCYRNKRFESDEERLEYLFKFYENMILEKNEGNTLFQ